jgi:hypothetical protein
VVLYSFYYGNIGASSSISDVYGYVVFRNLLNYFQYTSGSHMPAHNSDIHRDLLL